MIDGERADALQAERGKQYGDFDFNMRELGRRWGTTLRYWYQLPDLPDPPPHIVALMMVDVKTLRAATPTPHHQDNYDDAFVYLRQANKQSKEGSKEGS